MTRAPYESATAPTSHSAADPAEFNVVCRSKSNLPNRTDSNAAPLMCRTKLNTVRLWSDFRVTADLDGVLASDLIREGHGKQFSMRIYAF